MIEKQAIREELFYKINKRKDAKKYDLKQLKIT